MFISMTAGAMISHLVFAGLFGCLVGGLIVYCSVKSYDNVKKC